MSSSTDLPPVYFNHLYVVLDDKTYRAIQASDFLRSAFPGMERRGTLTAAGETWYGTYFYCRDNYLEFFGASTGRHWQPGAQDGWAGVAFSTDQAGGVAKIRQALIDRYHYTPFSELRQLRTPQKTVNWFHQVKLVERLSLGSFDSWVMEYHPEIFSHKGIELLSESDLTREMYLSPWNKDRWEPLPANESPAPAKTASPTEEQPTSTTHGTGKDDERAAAMPKGKEISHQPARVRKDERVPPTFTPNEMNFPRTPIFSRLTGATIHMDSARAEHYADILQMFGYEKEKSASTLALSAHGFTLLIKREEAAPPGYRLSSLRLEMARPSVAPMVFVFATGARLALNENLTAEWFFGR